MFWTWLENIGWNYILSSWRILRKASKPILRPLEGNLLDVPLCTEARWWQVRTRQHARTHLRRAWGTAPRAQGPAPALTDLSLGREPCRPWAGSPTRTSCETDSKPYPGKSERKHTTTFARCCCGLNCVPQVHTQKPWPTMWWDLEVIRWGREGGAPMTGLILDEKRRRPELTLSPRWGHRKRPSEEPHLPAPWSWTSSLPPAGVGGAPLHSPSCPRPLLTPEWYVWCHCPQRVMQVPVPAQAGSD